MMTSKVDFGDLLVYIPTIAFLVEKAKWREYLDPLSYVG